MRIVLDIEANGLTNPTEVWVIVCKDIDTNERHIFRNVTQDVSEKERFRQFINGCDYVVGHNLLGYDLPILDNLLGVHVAVQQTLDTLIISKLVDYPRATGHSLESYGEEFNLLKGFELDTGEILESKYFPQSFFLSYSKDLENYCIRDVEITHRIHTKYKSYIEDLKHIPSIRLEHSFNLVTNTLSNNGFAFNINKAKTLLENVTKQLSILDKDINLAFKPRLKLIRTVLPRETKYGTINASSIPVSLRGDLSVFSVGSPFCHCTWTNFNPSSHKQIIQVLNEAGWSPTDKTQTHIDTERTINNLKYRKKDQESLLTLAELETKLIGLQKMGWKVNENNLNTLPPSAPHATRLLAKRILLESRRRTLTEWLDLVQEDNRIHGRFYGVGAWTHRMAHQKPNTANIPNELNGLGHKNLLGKEMRQLWIAPRNRLLVGVDAEGIQLRIFAHYINDPEFTEALVRGKKDDQTDPHSLNRRILGSVCTSRQAAKRYIYALLLGAGKGKLQEILGCNETAAAEAYERLLQRYTGFALLKETVIPADAKRGWFTGLDGRRVRIPGETTGQRRHLAMSGYLQNGEAIIMKSATLKWWQRLEDYDAKLVNLVHDEWQVECPNNMNTALSIAEMMASSLEEVGRDLKLICPLAGSYWNDDLKDYTIATNWSKTH